MQADPTITINAYARALSYLFGVFGDSADTRSKLLQGINISPKALESNAPQISADDKFRFLENIAQLKGPDWVWRHSELWNGAALGVFGKAIVNAAHCEEAISVILRFGAFVFPDMYFEFFEDYDGPEGDAAVHTLSIGFVFTPHDNLNIKAQTLEHSRDIMMLCLFDVFDKALNRSWGRSQIWFTGPLTTTPHFNNLLFKRPLRLGQPRNAFSLSDKQYRKPSKTADKAAFQQAITALTKLLTPPVKDHAFKLRVATLLGSITEGRPSAVEVASQLGVSLRSLNRHLKEDETSFRQLLDSALLIRAKSMLESQTLSRGQISDNLGFKDQASFSRALKRWKQRGAL